MVTVLQSPTTTFPIDDNPEDRCLLRIPPDVHTLAGFREWALSDVCPEKMRLTFLDGVIYVDMSKEEILSHASVKTGVAGSMFNLNQELDFGDLFINGVLVTNVEADLSTNPDMVAISWQSLESGKVRYIRKNRREMEIEGSPDWMLEIVSASSVTKDRRDLRLKYHQAGVREYWLIDARGDEIDFQILHWRKSGYAAASHKEGWQSSRVFPRRFRLTRSKDRRGGWRYALETRAE